MTIRKNSIVVRKDGDGWSGTKYRVEGVDGRSVRLRSLDDYMLATEDTDNLTVCYQTDTFEQGDTVRARKEYVDQYNEIDGERTLTVTDQKSGNVTVTVVKNDCGDKFGILNERLYLVRPAKQFKAGDRVVVDFDLAKRFDNDGISGHWTNAGVMVLTEDSGSRHVKTTSHVKHEKDGLTNNVPTRWLKLYVEPAKRVVGAAIKADDIKVGDKIKATDTAWGLLREFTGVVADISADRDIVALRTKDRGMFPFEFNGTVYTLLEEAPEPVDENLQRLLDAEVGDIAHGTYANEYWKKVGDDEWQTLKESFGWSRTSEQVFISFYQLKYGTLEIYRQVEDGAE